jgi:hypothetical protein
MEELEEPLDAEPPLDAPDDGSVAEVEAGGVDEMTSEGDGTPANGALPI